MHDRSAPRGGPRHDATRRARSCSRPAASPPARSSSTRTGSTHERVLGLPAARACPRPGEPRFVPDYLDEQPLARAGVAVGRRTACARAPTNVVVAGAALPGAIPWREALRRGDRAGERLPGGAGGRAGRARRGRRRRHEPTWRIAARAAARIARSLRQVHDLRDACPVSNATPLFPGPKYAGPQAERYRVADEPSVDASVDYCSGCGICSRSARRASRSPRSTPRRATSSSARRASRCATGSSRGRPGWAGRHAGRAARQLVARASGRRGCSPRSCSECTATRRSPKFAGRRFSRWARGRDEPGDRRARSSTSTAAAPSTTSHGRARRWSRCSSTTASRSMVPKQDCCGLPLQSSGLFDDARRVVLRLARGARGRSCATRTRSSSATRPAAR